MKDAKRQYLIAEEATLGDVLIAITENKRGCAVVTDQGGVLLGVVSDGDVRRALVKGATDLTPVLKILNRNVLSLPPHASPEASTQLFAEHPEINLIPVVNAGNVVVDVVVRTSKTA